MGATSLAFDNQVIVRCPKAHRDDNLSYIKKVHAALLPVTPKSTAWITHDDRYSTPSQVLETAFHKWFKRLPSTVLIHGEAF
jgi:hypothetical protein